MNYYEPKQRTDGRWDYTRNNRPAGYCCEFRPFDEEFIKNFHISDSEVEKHNKFADKYHADGHATQEECCDCYKEYLLDHNLRFAKDQNSQHKCQVCKEWTQNVAYVDCQTFILCDEHNTREEISKLYSAPQWSMSSW